MGATCYKLQVMTNGSGVWVINSSYNRVVIPLVSGMGWVFYYTVHQKEMYDSFYEFLPNAGYYRGELRVLITALESFTNSILAWSRFAVKKGTFFKSKECRQRIPTNANQSDVKLILTGFELQLHICDHLNYWLCCRPTISRNIVSQMK